MPDIHTDSSGNLYINVDNLRITLVLACNRDPEDDWADGEDCIRFQAYKDLEKSDALYQGAEIPLGEDPESTVFKVMEALVFLHDNRD